MIVIVAPLVGAWIEIDVQDALDETRMSLLSWERGLKYMVTSKTEITTPVAPLVGAWIEIAIQRGFDNQAVSLLSWERGLKYCHVGYLH